MEDVEQFARDKDMEDIIPLLKHGAIAAQNPLDFETQKGLTDEERDVLRYEITHKWRHPKPLYFTIILCSVGAAVQLVLLRSGFRLFADFLTEDGIRLVPTAQTCPSRKSLE